MLCFYHCSSYTAIRRTTPKTYSFINLKMLTVNTLYPDKEAIGDPQILPMHLESPYRSAYFPIFY
ncbi:unnamed protein product [Acanthoscelides obtectus]|uniref:Uncharacterized protein n=1 Tax=Acanthoscelides obtectus TaxID=200917 RepID=A0A9P0JWA9_ACAOB|nr:unnamed protein product [Acanthoscelides obtectus]CAK1621933.1 hypothetical protein AOBTE_LOCUS1221 [Acanthoscelides obtectus]